MHTYIAMRPHDDGQPKSGGYRCGACGLEGLLYGEPHYSAVGRACEPAVGDVVVNHPQAAFAGKPIAARANPNQGNGHLLERLNDEGEWTYDNLAPANPLPTVLGGTTTTEDLPDFRNLDGSPVTVAPVDAPVDEAPAAPASSVSESPGAEAIAPSAAQQY